MKLRLPFLYFLLAILLSTSSAISQQPKPQRPRITGISHVGYFVSDLPKTLSFWHDLLGYDEAYNLKKVGSDTDIRIAFIKINDHQHIELFNEPSTHPPSMMSHLCFTVDDVEQMRTYLRSKGFDVKPGKGKTRTGDYAFEINDPDGTLIEFVQSLPTGMEVQAAGKFLPTTRISDGIYHVGFIVGNSEKSIAFYHDILGFQETWRGSSDGKELSWINMRVPDGTDYIELMLYHDKPSGLGGKNHISLVVPDIQKSLDTLSARPAVKTQDAPLKINIGKNHKRQINLFDPDGTRVEFMEPDTTDGKPVEPSTAPPPPPSHD